MVEAFRSEVRVTSKPELDGNGFAIRGDTGFLVTDLTSGLRTPSVSEAARTLLDDSLEYLHGC